MRLSIAALAAVLALPAAAEVAPAPARMQRPEATTVAPIKAGAAKPGGKIAKSDCRTPRKVKKPNTTQG
ncbi:MAG: hypothetical protein ACRD3R_03635 [Terriglobales bacterium]